MGDGMMQYVGIDDNDKHMVHVDYQGIKPFTVYFDSHEEAQNYIDEAFKEEREGNLFR